YHLRLTRPETCCERDPWERRDASDSRETALDGRVQGSSRSWPWLCPPPRNAVSRAVDPGARAQQVFGRSPAIRQNRIKRVVCRFLATSLLQNPAVEIRRALPAGGRRECLLQPARDRRCDGGRDPLVFQRPVLVGFARRGRHEQMVNSRN